MDLLLLFHLICGRGRDLDLHLCLQEEVIRGGQLVATERADGVTMEPLEDAVLVEDVRAGHGPERRRCSSSSSSSLHQLLLLLRPPLTDQDDDRPKHLRQMAQSS